MQKHSSSWRQRSWPALSSAILEELLLGVDWEGIRATSELPARYNGYPSAALLAAHSLPYVLPLQSERALSRELTEYELLQRLCGFIGDGDEASVPTRATLWHFRTRHVPGFQRGLLRGLVALVVLSKRLHFDLPFVTELEFSDCPGGVVELFELVRPKVKAQVCAHEAPDRKPRAATTEQTDGRQLPLSFSYNGEAGDHSEPITHRRRDKSNIAAFAGLPASITLYVPHQPPAFARLNQPEWFYSDLHEKDRLTELGPAHRIGPYTACSILVPSLVSGREHILLAKRLTGTGAGQFGLPGGKKSPNETVEGCAARELKEEAGINLIRSRPVSYHKRQLVNGPIVTSVGVLAEDYVGEPRRIEVQIHDEWEWFPVEELPTPLFPPTHEVIRAYLDQATTQLTWGDVEVAAGKELTLFDELVRREEEEGED